MVQQNHWNSSFLCSSNPHVLLLCTKVRWREHGSYDRSAKEKTMGRRVWPAPHNSHLSRVMQDPSEVKLLTHRWTVSHFTVLQAVKWMCVLFHPFLCGHHASLSDTWFIFLHALAGAPPRPRHKGWPQPGQCHLPVFTHHATCWFCISPAAPRPLVRATSGSSAFGCLPQVT